MEKSNLINNIRKGFYTAGFLGLGAIYGCKDSITEPPTINPPQSRSPQIELSVSPPLGISPLEISVLGKCTDPDNDIADYRVMKGNDILTRTNPTDTTTMLNEGSYFFYSKCRDKKGNEVTSDTSYVEVQPQPCEVLPVRDKIAFLRIETRASGDDAENRDIWLMDRDGSNQVNITNKPGGYYNLDFSPDGKWIAFENLKDIYVISSNGACLRNLTSIPSLPSSAGSHHFSPDGSRILFQSSKDGNLEVFVVNIDGSDLTNLTNNPAHDRVARWSPDGTQISFVRSNGIYIMDSDGSNQRSIYTGNPMNPIHIPEWSFDGNQIAFIKWNDGGPTTNNLDIYVINSDGAGLRRVTDGFDPNELQWSPKSNKLLFNSAWDRAQDNYVINNFGERGEERLYRIRIPGNDFDPSWSPDGKEFSFTSTVYGNWEIVSFEPNWDNFSQSILKRITNNSFSDHSATWSPQ